MDLVWSLILHVLLPSLLYTLVVRP